MAEKLGILGGTFNPIHYGHLAAAEEVRERLRLDRVLFVPSFLPPHKQEADIPTAEQRMEMVRLATRGNTSFEPSEVELRRGGRSYSIDTIEALRRDRPGAELYFITGIDSFLDIQTWHEWERLLTFCKFVVLSRPGYHFSDLLKIGFMREASQQVKELDLGERTHAVVQSGPFEIHLELIPLYDISSTDIRRRVKEGARLKYLLPEAVETYIIKNKLYA